MNKIYLKTIHWVLFFISGTVCMFSQQDVQYTQYMYNPTTVNPAYAGNRKVLSVIGLHRSQWVGLDGAPRSQSLSIHSPVGSGRVGVGGNIVRDEIGPSEESFVSADFSYTIPTSEKANLSFGLKATAHLLNVNFQKLDFFGVQSDDPRFQNSIDNRFSPNVGVGLFYHNERFYAGLSAPNLLETKHFENTSLNDENATSFLSQERVNYYLTTGYVFDLSSNLKFKPATLLKLVDGAPLQVDITANFLYNERFTLGAAYRWDAAFSGLVGFNINEGMMIGFAYDREVTELGNATFNDGSFELFLRFELRKSYSNIITPRFF